MSTLTEVEQAAEALPPEEQESLFERLSVRVRQKQLNNPPPQSGLHIAPVSLGRMLRPLGQCDDLPGEMLQDRR